MFQRTYFRKYTSFPSIPKNEFTLKKYQSWFPKIYEMFRSTYFRKHASFPSLPENEFKSKKYQGPNYQKLRDIRKTNLNPALETFYSKPLALHQGYKQWLFDINGKRYLDMFGGICTVSVGHCHPRITRAVYEQMNTLCHVSNIYFHAKIHEYAEQLVATMPGDLKVVYFVNSGSEANDLAMLMTRAYTGRDTIISLKNSYHGMTYQVMGLTSTNHHKYPVSSPSGILTAMHPDIYRGIWGGSRCRDSPEQSDRQCFCEGTCEAGMKYADQVRQEMAYNVPKNGLAGFWTESIQGLGGIVQFPKNYIKTVHESVKEAGGLFVVDEVQTGFGRTGDHFWGFEMHGIIPDIVTMAKGIGNGFPLAAVVTTEKVATGLKKSGHFNTFGGNPVACAVGMTVLDIIRDEQLQKNAKEVGTYLLLKLADLKSRFSVVGDVRGKGLIVGVELVEDRHTREPLKYETFLEILEYCRDAGLLIGEAGLHGNVLRIEPPMCITKEDVDYTITVLEEAFKNLEISSRKEEKLNV